MRRYLRLAVLALMCASIFSIRIRGIDRHFWLLEDQIRDWSIALGPITSLPLVRSGLPPRRVARLALASDTLSITTMEIMDTLIVVLIPGALNAGLGDTLFWGSLAVALVVAGVFAFPVNRWLIERGKGHAVIHGLH
jgi:hypothetical protein